jgi:predicted dehydrogenase
MPVRLGFIGAGFMGQLAHIANYATVPECELVALAEGRSKTAEAVARRYGIQRIYENHREMLEKEDLDGVVAIMGYHLYHAVVPDILEAGVNLATEKPMCVRVETAQKLADVAQEKGLIYQVGYMKRHDPAAKLVRETVLRWRETGECGALNYVRITMPPGNWTYEIEGPINMGDPAPQYENETPEPMPEWMPGEMKNAYNSFINFYIHQVNLLRYLIGEDYHVEYVDPSSRVMVAISEGGVPCVLEMAPYGLKNRWDEFYKICFDNGKIDLKIPAPMARQRAGEVIIYRGDKVEFAKPDLPQRWAFREQAIHFVECIREGKPTISPASEAVKDLEVSEEFIRCLMRSRDV